MSDYPPIFQSIFGAAWDQLPAVFLKHYANRPFCSDVVVIEGTMAVEMSWLTRLCAPLLRLSGALVPIEECDIPVTVTFRSEADSAAFCFDREFRFPDCKPYHFRSAPIASIRPGDSVLAFDGFGALVPRRVTKTFRNVTQESLELSFVADGAPETLTATPTLTVTPGRFEQMHQAGRA